MIPSQTLEEFEPFAESGDKVAPVPAKYAQGYLPGEVFPAQHENFLMGKASRCSTQHRSGLRSIEAELNNVVDAGGAEPDDTDDTQVLDAINYLIAQAIAAEREKEMPKGFLWWTSTPPTSPGGNPNTLFPGTTWVRIKDTFIYAAGDNDTVTSAQGEGGHTTAEDGSLSVSLSTDNLPAHNHKVSKSFTHGHRLWVYNGGQESISNVYGFSTPASNRSGANGAYAIKPSYNTSGSPYVEEITINLSATSDNNTTLHTDVNITPSRIMRFCWERVS